MSTQSSPGTKKFAVRKIGRQSGVVHEYITIVDEDDAHLLRSSYWHVVSSDNGTGAINHYVARTTAKGKEYLHNIVIGAEPDELVVHINHNSLDNRKSNLLRSKDRVREIE